MDFNEFCAAAISPYHLEALEGWEQVACTAYMYFEQEGNRVITIEELAQVFIETLSSTRLYLMQAHRGFASEFRFLCSQISV